MLLFECFWVNVFAHSRLFRHSGLPEYFLCTLGFLGILAWLGALCAP